MFIPPNSFVLVGGGHTDVQMQHPAGQNSGLLFNRPLVSIGLK